MSTHQASTRQLRLRLRNSADDMSETELVAMVGIAELMVLDRGFNGKQGEMGNEMLGVSVSFKRTPELGSCSPHANIISPLGWVTEEGPEEGFLYSAFLQSPIIAMCYVPEMGASALERLDPTLLARRMGITRKVLAEADKEEKSADPSGAEPSGSKSAEPSSA